MKPIDSYNLYISELSTKGYKKANSSPITSTSCTVAGLELGKKYYFVITGLTHEGGKETESNPSQEFVKMPDPLLGESPPPAQAAPAGGDASGKIVIKGWEKPGKIAGMNIYMTSSSGRGYKKANDQPITGTAYTVLNLARGSAYYFVLTQVSKDSPPVESAPTKEFSMQAK